jgi:hypothetical protein
MVTAPVPPPSSTPFTFVRSGQRIAILAEAETQEPLAGEEVDAGIDPRLAQPPRAVLEPVEV